MTRSPIIGLSPNAFPAENRAFYKHKPLEYGDASMATAVRHAGGLPFMLYRAGVTEADEMDALAGEMVSRVAGLVLTGGADVNPGMYGEDVVDERWRGDPERDRWEIALYRAAVAQGRPVLGVCRGAQIINVAEGGSLWQDLVTMRADTKVHRSQEQYDALGHEVDIAPDSELFELMGDDAHWVNSVHHQGMKELAPTLTEIARSPDGVVEAMVREGQPWVLAVQWHPEWMQDLPGQRRLFERLVELAQDGGEL